MQYRDPNPQQFGGKTFVLHHFPPIAGREIISKYPVSALPKLGDYKVNEETMLKLMAYVGVVTESNPENAPLMLSTRSLIDNHVPDWETLAKIEMAMMEYNCSFFGNGKASGFLDKAVRMVMSSLSQTLTASSAPSSPADKQA